MRNYWLVSDTHFCHDNVIGYCDRPWTTSEEMDEGLIENWNSVVRPEDKVYHLGDVYMGDRSYDRIGAILKRLNGHKRLILGNHDSGKDPILYRYFEQINVWKKWGDVGLLLTHVPVHPTTLGETRFDGKEFINVHGHIHQNKSPDGPYRCVCVEQINYTPINIEEIRMA